MQRRTGQEGRQREETSLLWMVDYVWFLFSFCAKSGRALQGSETQSANKYSSGSGEELAHHAQRSGSSHDFQL